MSDKQKKGGGARKYGRASRKNCKVQYKNRGTRARNKLARVRQSNGEPAAKQYAKGITDFRPACGRPARYKASHEPNWEGKVFPRDYGWAS